MRLGIRAKLIGTLLVAGLLPLALTLDTVRWAPKRPAYRRGGLLASVWTHFLLNRAHILLFTYPLLRHP